jgi:hypothetical protein
MTRINIFEKNENCECIATWRAVSQDRPCRPPLLAPRLGSFFGAINVSPLNDGEYFEIDYLPNAFYLRVR